MENTTEQKLNLGREIYNAVIDRCGYGVFVFQPGANMKECPKYVELTIEKNYNSVFDQNRECVNMTDVQLTQVLDMVRSDDSNVLIVRRLYSR